MRKWNHIGRKEGRNVENRLIGFQRGRRQKAAEQKAISGRCMRHNTPYRKGGQFSQTSIRSFLGSRVLMDCSSELHVEVRNSIVRSMSTDFR